MTPAIHMAKKAKIPHTGHKYSHDPSTESYGGEAAHKLNIAEERVFKTLVVSDQNQEFAVGVVPVSSMLDLKRIAKVIGSKKASMANPSDVERSTGYILGGVSPLGQKKRRKNCRRG